MCCCSSSQLQDLHPYSQEPGGFCRGSCLSSLPVPGGTSGLCWIRAPAGLKKSCFPAGAEGGGCTLCSWVCLWNQNSVVFSSPRFAARCLFLSLQRFPAPLLHLPCGGEPHPRKGTLMSGSEALLLLESEQGCRFSSPIGVG